MSQSYPEIGKSAKIRQGLPVSLLGLDFYPITMSYYEEYLSCLSAFTLRISSLPVKYLTKDFLNAVFQFELDNKSDGVHGLLLRVLKMLQLSLRVDWGHNDFSELLQYKTVGKQIEIEHLRIRQGIKTITITPNEFSNKIRKLIAELNGFELPNESENLDLVIANDQKKQQSQSKIKLDINTDSLISSVAYLSGCREKDINAWTVREFENRRKAIDRDKRYMLCSQADMGGMVSFKNGNPSPSWCYDVFDDTLGTKSLSEINFGDAKQREL